MRERCHSDRSILTHRPGGQHHHFSESSSTVIGPPDAVNDADFRSAAESELSAWDRIVDEMDVRMAILDRFADWRALIHLLRQRRWKVKWQEQDTILMVRSP